MCGIAGYSLDDQWTGDSKLLTAQLATALECRGRDATGVCWVGKGGGFAVQKAPEPATRFVEKLTIGTGTRTAMIHTRLATKGKPSNNDNNHPIVVGNAPTRTFGVHNGQISNDDGIFRRLKDDYGTPRIAEVDSEALFAYVHHKGFEEMGPICGGYAALWMYEEHPHRLYALKGRTSPLHVARCAYGYIFASLPEMLRDVEELVGGYEVEVADDSPYQGQSIVRFVQDKELAIVENGLLLEYGMVRDGSAVGWLNPSSGSGSNGSGSQSNYQRGGANSYQGDGYGYYGVAGSQTPDRRVGALATSRPEQKRLGDEGFLAPWATTPSSSSPASSRPDASLYSLNYRRDRHGPWIEHCKSTAKALWSQTVCIQTGQTNNAWLGTYYIGELDAFLHCYENGWVKTDQAIKPAAMLDSNVYGDPDVAAMCAMLGGTPAERQLAASIRQEAGV